MRHLSSKILQELVKRYRFSWQPSSKRSAMHVYKLFSWVKLCCPDNMRQLWKPRTLLSKRVSHKSKGSRMLSLICKLYKIRLELKHPLLSTMLKLAKNQDWKGIRQQLMQVSLLHSRKQSHTRRSSMSSSKEMQRISWNFSKRRLFHSIILKMFCWESIPPTSQDYDIPGLKLLR